MKRSISTALAAWALVACQSEQPVALHTLTSSASVAPSAKPVLACDAITTGALGVAGLQLSAAQAVAAVRDSANESENYPAHCLVTGSLNERVGSDGKSYAIGFKLRLPTVWNRRFFFQGGGGTDGTVLPAFGVLPGVPTNALSQGFAVVSMDGGHTSEALPLFLGGVLFGLDPQARIDYGYNALGVVTTAAKQIVERVYGSPIDRSYFVGCSNGGRQAMVAAARFGDAFDGIIAGNPGFNLPKAAVQHAWDYQQLLTVDADSPSEAFRNEEMALVSERINAKCDALDGAVDGMVNDARACNTAFDLDTDVPACSNGQRTGACLTPAQKAAMRNMVSGPVDSQGTALYSDWPWDPGIGSNHLMAWRGWKLGVPELGGFSLINTMGAASLAYVFTTPPAEFPASAALDPVPALLDYLTTYDFDRDAPKIYATAGPFTESSASFMLPPDPTQLSTFAANRGKLLVYHGTADPVFSSNDTTRWYDALTAQTQDARDFARLFLVPGMGHCNGGPATDSLDVMSALVDWVETDTAPEAVLARVNPASDSTPTTWSKTRTRPLCAYPSQAMFKPGATDLESAASFTCNTESSTTHDERQTIVPDPTWTCGLPEGIPGPLTGQPVFDIDFDVAEVHDLGDTPFGHRRVVDVRGGTIDGPKARGSVLPRGLEYDLTLDDGTQEIEQIHVLRLGDELVYMRNCGVSPSAGAPARIVLSFEAPNRGAHAFLNTGRFVATRVYDPELRLSRLKVYDVISAVTDPNNSVRVVKPTSRPAQRWECEAHAGTQGAEVYRATVDIATTWLTVGESKHGTRNIIPIHGGTLSGKLAGRVLPGGADYQIITDNFNLDARYTLQTDDGELIVVRNCGPLGGLIPTFETRRDGPYNWLNEGKFRSADPAPSADLSQINLIIYAAQ